MALDSDHHIRCTRETCAFVVHDRYFADKVKFTPGICPNCGGVLKVTDPFVMEESLTHVLQTNPRKRSFRRVVTIAEAESE